MIIAWTSSASLVILLTVGSGVADAQAVGQSSIPPAARDLSVTSLHRAEGSWEVVTTIWLIADTSDDRAVAFHPLQPAHGELKCDDPAEGARSVACRYTPRLRYTGADSFAYTVSQGTGDNQQMSRPATVTIDVRSTGLRWEFQAGASTGLTSDSDDVSSLPDILGGTNQDLLFTLNWQVKRPWRKTPTAVDPVNGRPTPENQPVLSPGATGTLNVLIRTGLKANPVAAEVMEVESGAMDEAAGETSSEAPAEKNMASVVQQQFLAEAEVNWNHVRRFDGSGSFLEVGLLGKAGFDVSVEAEDSFLKTAEQLVEVIRAERGTFRYEGGVRFAVKQYHEDEAASDTWIYEAVSARDGGQPAGRDANRTPVRASRQANMDDLLAFELTIQRNDALAGLDDQDGDSRNRWAMRFMAYPEIPLGKKHTRFMIGMEVSQALSGGPKNVSFLYGGAVSLGGGAP